MAAIFADDILKCIFMNEKFCISIQISLKFVPKGPIDNKSALVQVMACCITGDKPLSEPMLTRFADTYAILRGDELMIKMMDPSTGSNVLTASLGQEIGNIKLKRIKQKHDSIRWKYAAHTRAILTQFGYNTTCLQGHQLPSLITYYPLLCLVLYNWKTYLESLVDLLLIIVMVKMFRAHLNPKVLEFVCSLINLGALQWGLMVAMTADAIVIGIANISGVNSWVLPYVSW